MIDPASDPVLAHVLDAISPASAAQAYGARMRLGGQHGRDLDRMQSLAERLAAARHAPQPAVARKLVVVCAADHGVVAAGDASATRAALRQIATGEAAVCAAARAAQASLVLVDCGVRADGASTMPATSPAGIVDVRIGNGTADMRAGAAMTPAQALACLHTGIALLLSLVDAGADIIALGHLGVGSRVASGALVAVLTGVAPATLGMRDRDAIAAALAASRPDPAQPLAVLAAVGGFEIGVMTGLVLAAASLDIPVVLDDHGTSAAALLAARLQPHVAGYLFASHAGSTPGHRRALHALGLPVIFDVGVAQGEATGAILALPIIDSAARLLAPRDPGA